MRSLVAVCLCLSWITRQAQTVDSKVGLHAGYLPQFTVQEASGSNVPALAMKLSFI